jgi:FtsP/CotA-like multicopper oxidase with cupredoxin domain
MRFVVDATINGAAGSTDGTTTVPANLLLHVEPPLGSPDGIRRVSLNEEESAQVCVEPRDDDEDEESRSREKQTGRDDRIRQLKQVKPGPDFFADCEAAGGQPFGPTAALLGTVTGSGAAASGNPLGWTDGSGVSSPVTVFKVDGTPVTVNVTETPAFDSTEDWEIYNFTEDAHPIHLHLVRFEVIGRTSFDGNPSPINLRPGELGFTDTVLAFPGEITTIRARFDVRGLYVWHCHIVEHEDNEMMRPYVVE